MTESARIPDLPSETTNTVPFPTDGARDEQYTVPMEHQSGENLKRIRSDSGATTDGEDDRPLNRPRTELYTAADIPPPSPLGWILQPLKAFARGFRESLGGDGPPNI
jgi:hypothetical protein